MATHFINPENLFTSVGYTQVVAVGGEQTVYISGQVALNTKGDLVGEGDLAAQTKQVYENLRIALNVLQNTTHFDESKNPFFSLLMDTRTDDTNQTMRLDGNAAAGELQMLLGFDVTTLQVTCSHCHQSGLLARLLAYVRGPGIVLRCPTCEGVVIQLVRTPSAVIINAEGTASGLRSGVIPH